MLLIGTRIRAGSFLRYSMNRERRFLTVRANSIARASVRYRCFSARTRLIRPLPMFLRL